MSFSIYKATFLNIPAIIINFNWWPFESSTRLHHHHVYELSISKHHADPYFLSISRVGVVFTTVYKSNLNAVRNSGEPLGRIAPAISLLPTFGTISGNVGNLCKILFVSCHFMVHDAYFWILMVYLNVLLKCLNLYVDL